MVPNMVAAWRVAGYHTTTLTFELSDVIALFRSDSRSLRATGVDMAVSISTALAAAFSKDSDIVVGWIPITKH